MRFELTAYCLLLKSPLGLSDTEKGQLTIVFE